MRGQAGPVSGRVKGASSSLMVYAVPSLRSPDLDLSLLALKLHEGLLPLLVADLSAQSAGLGYLYELHLQFLCELRLYHSDVGEALSRFWCEDPADYCLLLSLNLLLRLCSTLIIDCGSLHLGESAAAQGFKFFVRIVFLGHQLAAPLGLAFNSFATSAAVLFKRVRPCLVSFRPFLPSIATRSAF